MKDVNDARIDVVVGDRDHARVGDLTLAVPAPTQHLIGCRCCGGRDPLASALAAAFVARARGDIPWFDRVLLIDVGQHTERVAETLESDPVTRARFRLHDSFM